MSIMVKQRKRLSNKAIVIITLCLTLALAVLGGFFAVWAFNHHTFNSSVKISYKAVDISGSVTMYAKAAPKSENYTAMLESEKIGKIEFTPTTDTSSKPAEININQINLNSTDNTLYLHYYFENFGSRPYTAVLNFAETDIINQQNMTLAYSETGTDGSYVTANSGLVVMGKGSKDYFVRISVEDLAFNADFEGVFTWQLKECSDLLSKVEEKSLAATTFTVISESANTYSAKYNGGDISSDGEISGLSNDVHNYWYIPAAIDDGTIIKVIKGELLPENTKVNIPNSVTEIGNNAFDGCVDLVGVDIANSVKYIRTYAFRNCSGLLDVKFPSSLTHIYNNAFQNCDSLRKIDIPIGVTYVAYSSFSGCDNLTEVSISNTVKTIGTDSISAFTDCKNLMKITVEEGNENYYTSGNCLIEKANKKLVQGCNTSVIPQDGNILIIGEAAFQNLKGLQEIEIPISTTTIERDAFEGCVGLTKVSLKNGLTTIGNEAFYKCSSLQEIEIPNSVTSIGSDAFGGCKGLTKVLIGDGVVSISSSAFYGCSALTEIKIPGNVKTIDSSAFTYCSGLTSVILGNGLTSIGSGAFQYCDKITEIEIPTTVTDIGEGVFARCSQLQKITVLEGNTKYHSSGNCLIETESKALIQGCSSSVLPNNGSVTSINNYAFSGSELLTRVEIPNGVTYIGKCAFEYCSLLTEVIMPESLTTIEERAFMWCKKLESIEIPANVTSIMSFAFAYCQNLTSVEFKVTTEWIYLNSNTATTGTALDPAGLANEYTAASLLKSSSYHKYPWKRIV